MELAGLRTRAKLLWCLSSKAHVKLLLHLYGVGNLSDLPYEQRESLAKDFDAELEKQLPHRRKAIREAEIFLKENTYV